MDDRKPLRTDVEKDSAVAVARIFEQCSDSTQVKLENFTKYVRRQHLKRFLAMYEVFKLALPVKGSIVECGVFRGFGLMAWAKLSAMLEPENLTRRIYGFDTFAGFPSIGDRDQSVFTDAQPGDLGANSYDELTQLIREYDRDRFLGHMPKVELIRGDIAKTIPEFAASHPHLVVSLLYLDADMYEPTKVALQTLLPRMPKGALVVFDELDNPIWPGETLGAMDAVGLPNLRLRRMEWDPYIAFAVIE
ncbi:MAG TPA: TylF/MycF/NovP-related O-methyltransferase [Bryobacteraceae bacterium]|nr:TylF/MycF/NovP-related O-methyltransferase [Bryobacteraceae bacterium]